MGDRQWKELLNWTLKNAISDTNDNDNTTKFKKMSKEDLDFLTKALESTKEAEKQLETAIKDTVSFVNGEFQLDDANIMKNLYIIESYLDEHPAHSLDIAKNEILNTLMKLIESDNVEIVKLTLKILTSALGNNEVVSNEAFSRGLLDKLFSRIDGFYDISPIISTMSALVSSYPPSGKDFAKFGRYNLLNSIFETNHAHRTKEKATMLIYHLVNNKVVDLNMLNVDGIIASILPFKDESLQFREVFGEMVLSIIENYPKQIDKVQLTQLLQSDGSKWDSDVLQQQLTQIKNFLNN